MRVPENVAKWLGRVGNAALNATIFILLVAVGWVAWNVVGSKVERHIMPPVRTLDFAPIACYDTHLVTRVRLNKSEYWNGSYAEYLALNLRITDPNGDTIRWYEFTGDWPDRRQRRGRGYSRPAGLSTFDLVLLDSCGHKFLAHTEHRSPITGLRLTMVFGPYDGTAPRKLTSNAHE